MWEKLKSFLANDSLFLALLVVLVGVTSFGLGRMSILEKNVVNQSASAIQELPRVNPQNSAINNDNVTVVASKSGSKYHFLDCPGALQMKEENRIEFSSKEEAEAAGYSPAANCPGL